MGIHPLGHTYTIPLLYIWVLFESLLRMQNQVIDENEAHKDICDELEDMDDEYDSA